MTSSSDRQTPEAGATSKASVRFPVEGMTCASCVNRIERYLNKVEGVEAASVNLATESASVRYDPSAVRLEDLGKAVEAAGYEARLEQAEGTDDAQRSITLAFSAPESRMFALDIEGMTCASCVNRIERYLNKLDGVTSANVNLATERATVTAEPSVTVAQILGAVEAAGYDARLITEQGEEPAKQAQTEPDPHAATREAAREPETSFQQRHLADTRRRLIVASLLTVPLLLALGAHDRGALPARLPGESLAPAGVRHAGPVLRRLAVLQGRLEGAPPPRHRHEHADRGRHLGGLLLQPGGHPVPGLLPRRRASASRASCRSTSTRRR